MITDEQVKVAANTYLNRPIDSYVANGNFTDMRKALEAYEQSKWVDIETKQPEPRQIVMNSNNVLAYWEGSKWKGVDGFVISSKAQYWQHLPEFKE